METVLSCSLLMAFSAAVTVFTISVCFSLSSFYEKQPRKRNYNQECKHWAVSSEKMCFFPSTLLLVHTSCPLLWYFAVLTDSRFMSEFLRQVQATLGLRHKENSFPWSSPQTQRGMFSLSTQSKGNNKDFVGLSYNNPAAQMLCLRYFIWWEVKTGSCKNTEIFRLKNVMSVIFFWWWGQQRDKSVSS